MMPMVVQPCPWRDLVPLFRGKGVGLRVILEVAGDLVSRLGVEL